MLTKESILRAKENWNKFHNGYPEQFNIQKFIDIDSEDEFFECEFCELSGDWVECTTWVSELPLVRKIFDTCDPDLVDVTNWEDDWEVERVYKKEAFELVDTNPKGAREMDKKEFRMSWIWYREDGGTIDSYGNKFNELFHDDAPIFANSEDEALVVAQEMTDEEYATAICSDRPDVIKVFEHKE